MIELTVFNFLKDNTDIPVYMEVPKEPPKAFYLIEKTGGSVEEHLGKSTIAIQSYASTLYNAASMSEDVVSLMTGELIEEDTVCRVSLNSQYNFTDTTEKRYRYQAVFDLIHY